MCVYIYIYVYRERENVSATANFCTRITDFRGFASSIILNFRGGSLMSVGRFPESLTQAILAGMILLGAPSSII